MLSDAENIQMLLSRTLMDITPSEGVEAEARVVVEKINLVENPRKTGRAEVPLRLPPTIVRLTSQGEIRFQFSTKMHQCSYYLIEYINSRKRS